jgi:hypothetical protein
MGAEDQTGRNLNCNPPSRADGFSANLFVNQDIVVNIFTSTTSARVRNPLRASASRRRVCAGLTTLPPPAAARFASASVTRAVRNVAWLRPRGFGRLIVSMHMLDTIERNKLLGTNYSLVSKEEFWDHVVLRDQTIHFNTRRIQLDELQFWSI